MWCDYLRWMESTHTTLYLNYFIKLFFGVGNNSRERKYFCCVPPAQNGTHCRQEEGGAGQCPGGEVRFVTDQCHDRCFNEYQNYQEERLGYRSRYRCADGECVWMHLMCSHGYAACRDKSDLAECREDVKCYNQEGNFTRHSLTSPLPHTSCAYALYQNNRVYDTIGRQDEENLTTRVRSSPVNYAELQTCSLPTDYEDQEQGLQCGSSCWRMS